jgi:hypothetical protein
MKRCGVQRIGPAHGLRCVTMRLSDGAFNLSCLRDVILMRARLVGSCSDWIASRDQDPTGAMLHWPSKVGLQWMDALAKRQL